MTADLEPAELLLQQLTPACESTRTPCPQPGTWIVAMTPRAAGVRVTPGHPIILCTDHTAALQRHFGECWTCQEWANIHTEPVRAPR